jgi:transcriptional regulator
MYVPELYAEQDIPTLHDFMRRHSFATVVTQHAGAPFASHLPLAVDSRIGAQGGLIGHLARANPQSEDLAAGAEVLAIFHGPHAYVSGGWYEPNPMAVPTWNYIAVHAYGRARVLAQDELEQTLHALAAQNEKAFASPWRLEISPDLRRRALPAIVGFEIVLHRIEGKFKLGQNRSVQDRKNVIARLSQSGHGRDVAKWMKQELEKEEK